MTGLTDEEVEYALNCSKHMNMTMFFSLEPQMRVIMMWNSISIILRKTDPAPPMSAEIRQRLLQVDAEAVKWANQPHRFIMRELRLIWNLFLSTLSGMWDLLMSLFKRTED